MQIIFRMVEAVSRIKSNEVANVAMSSSAGYMRMRYEPKVGCVAMSSSAAQGADRGGGAERRRGWEKNQHCSFTNFTTFNHAGKPLRGCG